MTFKNQAEIYQALLDGKKIKHESGMGYVFLNDGMLYDDYRRPVQVTFHNHMAWSIYEEPKKKVKLYKYTYKDIHNYWKESIYYYKDEEDFCKMRGLATKYIKLENNYIEVDDE